MQVLLDTHAFIWWFSGSDRLPLIVQQAIAEDGNDVFVSAASAWEITTKHRLGKIPNVTTLALDISGAIAAQNFRSLPITVDDASRAGTLPGPHRDPSTACSSPRRWRMTWLWCPTNPFSTGTVSAGSGNVLMPREHTKSLTRGTASPTHRSAGLPACSWPTRGRQLLDALGAPPPCPVGPVATVVAECQIHPRV